MRTDNCPIVVLVGRPNVGKSTFFNRITGTRQAIVDPTPGVTRDRHYDRVVWENRAFLLVDTGGIETDTSERMSGLVTEQTLQAVREADVVVFLMDGRQGLVAEDYEITALLRRAGKKTLMVVNKIDDAQQEERFLPQFYELGAEELWSTSAENSYGMPTFMDALMSVLPAQVEGSVLPADTIRLACIGRPNVGKSSLVNRLVGEERMIVSDLPGTTRDSVDSLLTRDGQNYLLIDTAGIRRKGKVADKLEKFSIIKALAAIERCDLAIIVLDAQEGITEQDTKIIGYALEQGRACLIVFNKWDLVQKDKKRQTYLQDALARSTRFVEYAPFLSISALTGKGVNQIIPLLRVMYQQYSAEFSTGPLNKLLRGLVDAHTPPIYKGKKIRLYYTTQVSVRPPTFAIFANDSAGVTHSYHRYLANKYREGLGLDKTPVRIVLKDRPRKPRQG